MGLEPLGRDTLRVSGLYSSWINQGREIMSGELPLGVWDSAVAHCDGDWKQQVEGLNSDTPPRGQWLRTVPAGRDCQVPSFGTKHHDEVVLAMTNALLTLPA